MSAKDVYANILLFKLSPAGKVLWSSPYGEGTGACVVCFWCPFVPRRPSLARLLRAGLGSSVFCCVICVLRTVDVDR